MIDVSGAIGGTAAAAFALLEARTVLAISNLFLIDLSEPL